MYVPSSHASGPLLTIKENLLGKVVTKVALLLASRVTSKLPFWLIELAAWVLPNEIMVASADSVKKFFNFMMLLFPKFKNLQPGCPLRVSSCIHGGPPMSRKH